MPTNTIQVNVPAAHIEQAAIMRHLHGNLPALNGITQQNVDDWNTMAADLAAFIAEIERLTKIANSRINIAGVA